MSKKVINETIEKALYGKASKAISEARKRTAAGLLEDKMPEFLKKKWDIDEEDETEEPKAEPEQVEPFVQAEKTMPEFLKKKWGIDEDEDEIGECDDEMGAKKKEVVAERKFDKNVGGGVDRDELKKKDFADPENRAFPIVTPKDVADAAKALNHKVKGDKDKIKKNIIKIAKAKGMPFEVRLPKEWR